MSKKITIFLIACFLSAGFFTQAANGQSKQTSTGTVQQVSNSTAIPQTTVPSLKTTLPPLELPEYEDEEDAKGSNSIFRKFINNVKDSFHTNFIKESRWHYLASGFMVTILISLAAVVLGIIIGYIVAVIRSISDQTGKLRFLNRLCKIYLTVIRGTPVVVQLLIIYFVIFGAMDVNKILVAIIAFGVNSGAYVTEIIRSGINSIDPGQLEAGRSLGLSYLQTMRLIVLPQAFKNVLPALGNEFISLLKETSISGYIALQDLTKGGDIIRSQTYDAFLPLTAVAIIYLAVVMIFTWLLGHLERRLKKNER